MPSHIRNFVLIIASLLVVFIHTGCRKQDAYGLTGKDAEFKAWVDRVLAEEVLADLVKRGVSKEELVSVYGEPTMSAAHPNGREGFVVNYTVNYPFLRDIPGRVGLQAILQDGKVVKCGAISM